LLYYVSPEVSPQNAALIARRWVPSYPTKKPTIVLKDKYTSYSKVPSQRECVHVDFKEFCLIL
jgi:hypothetical protein